MGSSSLKKLEKKGTGYFFDESDRLLLERRGKRSERASPAYLLEKVACPLFLTVTLNPTLDRSITVDNLKRGAVLRVKEVYYRAGGKGINVARVLRLLGEEVLTVLFKGGVYGDYLCEILEDENIKNFCVNIGGDIRSNLTIIDSSHGCETHLLEAGPEVSPEELKRFIKLSESKVKNVDFFILSGSIPQGVSSDIYKKLIEKAKTNKLRCALDTRGDALRSGLDAKPFLVKPNRVELEEILSRKLPGKKDIVSGSRELIEAGVGMVLVSLGREGAIFVGREEVWEAKPPEINVVSSVGSGDALLAGFISSYLKGESIVEAISLGCACGAANCLGPVPGSFNLSLVNKLRKKVKVFRHAF